MKLGTIAYVPPAGKLHSGAFMENITKFPAFHPLYTISDDACWSPSRLIKSPELVGRKPPHALNNYLWFSALQTAKDAGLDAFIYLESDSRVYGDGWDAVVFSEYNQRYEGIACAGTPVAWNICSGGREFAKKVVSEAFAFQQATGIPASFYSSKDPRNCSGGGIYYPNGSGAVYNTAAMVAVFKGFELDPVTYSKYLTAYDMALGMFLWNYHGPRAVEHVGWLKSTYSGFGDCMTTEAERLQMLRDGRCVVVHQVKSGASDRRAEQQ